MMSSPPIPSNSAKLPDWPEKLVVTVKVSAKLVPLTCSTLISVSVPTVELPVTVEVVDKLALMAAVMFTEL